MRKACCGQDQTDLAGLDELARRGKLNGIPLESISEAEAKTIEPRVKTCERALFSPATSTVDPTLVMEAMKMETQITAPRAGRIRFQAAAGAYVSAGAEIARIEE